MYNIYAARLPVIFVVSCDLIFVELLSRELRSVIYLEISMVEEVVEFDGEEFCRSVVEHWVDAIVSGVVDYDDLIGTVPPRYCDQLRAALALEERRVL